MKIITTVGAQFTRQMCELSRKLVFIMTKIMSSLSAEGIIINLTKARIKWLCISGNEASYFGLHFVCVGKAVYDAVSAR